MRHKWWPGVLWCKNMKAHQECVTVDEFECTDASADPHSLSVTFKNNRRAHWSFILLSGKLETPVVLQYTPLAGCIRVGVFMFLVAAVFLVVLRPVCINTQVLLDVTLKSNWFMWHIVVSQVQTLLQQMQDKFQTMSDQIIGRNILTFALKKKMPEHMSLLIKAFFILLHLKLNYLLRHSISLAMNPCPLNVSGAILHGSLSSSNYRWWGLVSLLLFKREHSCKRTLQT